MVTQSRQNLGQSVGGLIVVLLCVVAIGSLQLPQLNKLKNTSNTASVAELNKEVESEKLRLNLLQKFPSFGFNNLVADWTFINFLQYFGDDALRAKTGYSVSPEYFEVILNRDPYFLRAYFFLSGSTTLYAGMPDRTIALMEKGLKYLSPKVPAKSYYIWRYKGMNELLFTQHPQSAKQSFETAAQWASIYSDAESKNLARVSQQTAQFIDKNPQSKSAQITAWSMVLTNALDDRTRQFAIGKIRVLGGNISISPQGKVKIVLPKQD